MNHPVLIALALAFTASAAAPSYADESSLELAASSTRTCELCLYQPDNMAFDADGNIYLVDTDHKHRSRVLKLSPSGKVLADWRVFTDGPGTDNGPNGIAVDSQGNIYVPDGAAQRLLKLSPAGKVIGVFEGILGPYNHVAVDSDGNVYVTEPEQDTIEKFAPDGKPIARWHREHGSAPDQWHTPQTIALGKGNTLVIDDWGNDRIEVLSRSGETVRIFRAAGAPDEGLISASGACTDQQGHIYVADYQRNRVKEYDSDGHLIKTIEDTHEPRLFQRAPFSIACGLDGNLYSADGLSVVKYSKAGVLLSRWQ